MVSLGRMQVLDWLASPGQSKLFRDDAPNGTLRAGRGRGADGKLGASVSLSRHCARRSQPLPPTDANLSHVCFRELGQAIVGPVVQSWAVVLASMTRIASSRARPAGPSVPSAAVEA